MAGWLSVALTLAVAGQVFALMQSSHETKPRSAPRPRATDAGQSDRKTLYQRLGGYDAIAAVTDDFIARMLDDAKLGRFFAGHSTDSKKRIRQLIVDQLCAVTGGPCVYIGRDMKAAHAGMGISEEEWTLAVNHLVMALDKFQVGAGEKEELLALLTTLKGDIVEKK
jgi:hemoglobin